MGPAAQREPAVFHLLGKNDVYYVGIPSALTRPVTYTTLDGTRDATRIHLYNHAWSADSRLSRKSNVAAVACARCGDAVWVVGWVVGWVNRCVR